MDPISKELQRHYSETFSLHGPTSMGVDWGSDEPSMLLRYKKMLAIFDGSLSSKPSILDVGCGFGGLLEFSKKNDIDLDYTGVDVVANMIEWASINLNCGKFIHGDIIDYRFNCKFDYVVCNGILTQKMSVSSIDMDLFSAKLIKKMYSLCRRGIAFNIMTTKVNYFSNNLYYRNPSEIFSWCISEITPHIVIDHAYPLYEYTVYLYREPSTSSS